MSQKKISEDLYKGEVIEKLEIDNNILVWNQ